MFLTMIVFSAIREGKVVGKEVMSVHKKVQVVGTKKEGAKKRIKLTKSVRTARRLVLVARGFRFLQKSEELLDSRLESEEQEEEQEEGEEEEDEEEGDEVELSEEEFSSMSFKLLCDDPALSLFYSLLEVLSYGICARSRFPFLSFDSSSSSSLLPSFLPFGSSPLCYIPDELGFDDGSIARALAHRIRSGWFVILSSLVYVSLYGLSFRQIVSRLLERGLPEHFVLPSTSNFYSGEGPVPFVPLFCKTRFTCTGQLISHAFWVEEFHQTLTSVLDGMADLKRFPFIPKDTSSHFLLNSRGYYDTKGLYSIHDVRRFAERGLAGYGWYKDNEVWNLYLDGFFGAYTRFGSVESRKAGKKAAKQKAKLDKFQHTGNHFWSGLNFKKSRNRFGGKDDRRSGGYHRDGRKNSDVGSKKRGGVSVAQYKGKYAKIGLSSDKEGKTASSLVCLV